MGFLLLLCVAIVALLLYRVSTLVGRLNSLEWKLKDLESLSRSVADLREQVNALVKPKSIPKPEPLSSPKEKVRAASAPSPPVSIAPAQVPKLFAPLELPKPSRTRQEWEAFVGGKLLNRIGALALVFGVGFFLKYAFDNNWISETVRVLIGAVIGFALLASAYRMNKKDFTIFSQGLVGAGTAILYLSVYASFNFYHLVPQVAAFVLMSLVTALTVSQAIYYNALAVGVLGWAGGFLTPLMLNTGASNEAGLFTYLALLALGLLAVVVLKREWFVLHPLTLFGTWAMYWAWHIDHYSADALLLTGFFVVVFWGLFFAAELMQLVSGVLPNKFLSHAVAALNALMFFCAEYLLLNDQYRDWQGAATLAMGGVYFVALQFLKRRSHVMMDVLVRFTLTAIALLVVATGLQFESYRIPLVWSLEAAALCWCGVRWNLRFVRTAALAMFILVLLRLLAIESLPSFVPKEDFSLILNWRALTLTVFAVCLGVCAWLNRSTTEDERLLAGVLSFAATLVFGAMFSLESNDYFRTGMLSAGALDLERLSYARALELIVLWAAYALPLVWFGIRLRYPPLISSGLLWLGAAITVGVVTGIAFQPISQFALLVNIRAAQMFFLLVCTMIAARWIQLNTPAWDPFKEILPVVQVAMVVVAFVLLTGETRDAFQKNILRLQDRNDDSGELIQLQNLQQLALSTVWLFYSFVLMAAGLWRRVRGLRVISIVVFGFTILKIFVYDLSFLETLYRIFSFVGLSVILFAVSYAYQRWKNIILES